MRKKAPTTVKDKIAIVASVIAIAISITTFFKDNIFGQHALKASVVAIDSRSDESKLYADILLVNPGKHSEILFRAQFIFSDNLSKGGGLLSSESIGPIVLEPGKAALVRLESSNPTIAGLRENGTIKDAQDGFHVGVVFDVLTPSGELREDSKIFRITEFHFAGEDHVGSKPRPKDNNGFIDLI